MAGAFKLIGKKTFLSLITLHFGSYFRRLTRFYFNSLEDFH